MKLLIAFFMMTEVLAADIPGRVGNGSVNFAPDDVKSRRGEFIPPESVLDEEELNYTLFSELRAQNKDLTKIKYYLINGETRLASLHLRRLAYSNTKLRPVIYRYLAILSFMESNFERSFDYLNRRELKDIPHFGKICTFKVLTEIVLNKTSLLEEDWKRCQVENAGNLRERNLIWLETLIALKLNPRKGITKVPFRTARLNGLENDDVKVMLKLALYLNQEELVIDQIPNLSVDQLQDTEIRELIGQLYFRTGALAKSYKFVEDLKSPNSENIKGNLYLLRTKYELAYAQFKLALEEKQNSQNAMERLLPLAWLLGDWENGSKYSEKVIASPQTQINKLTLMAAFFMQKGDYHGADKVLGTIAERSRRGTEIDVTQLASFTALMQNQPDKIKKNALMSCSQFDLVNCWLLFQMGQWDAFPLTIRREEKVTEKRDWEKLVKNETSEPLKETVFVNQLDIEELDDKLIQLIPKN